MSDPTIDVGGGVVGLAAACAVAARGHAARRGGGGHLVAVDGNRGGRGLRARPGAVGRGARGGAAARAFLHRDAGRLFGGFGRGDYCALDASDARLEAFKAACADALEYRRRETAPRSPAAVGVRPRQPTNLRIAPIAAIAATRRHVRSAFRLAKSALVAAACVSKAIPGRVSRHAGAVGSAVSASRLVIGRDGVDRHRYRRRHPGGNRSSILEHAGGDARTSGTHERPRRADEPPARANGAPGRPARSPSPGSGWPDDERGALRPPELSARAGDQRPCTACSSSTTTLPTAPARWPTPSPASIRGGWRCCTAAGAGASAAPTSTRSAACWRATPTSSARWTPTCRTPPRTCPRWSRRPRPSTWRSAPATCTAPAW